MKPAPASPEAKPVTLRQLFDSYENEVVKDPKTMRTIRIHQEHVARILGAGTAVEAIKLVEVQKYCDLRSKETWHASTIRPYTIRKELRTFRQTWQWGHDRGYIGVAPAWQMKSLTLGQDRGREPFRTMAEIERRIGRGGLTDEEIDRLWECLYLTGDELRECLESIKVHATAQFVYPMVAFVSLTGCRRAEMLRSRIDDIDLNDGIVHVRERKRDTSKEFTMRTVDLHPMLRTVLSDWFAAHPGGQHTFCQGDACPLSENMATDHLNPTLKAGEKWRIIPGFHTFRHSFASILASKGVDQRLIDALIGHQTEEMKKRYQHLFPKTLKRAVEALLT